MRAYPSLITAYTVEAFRRSFSKNAPMPSFDDFVPAFMKPDKAEEPRQANAPYSEMLAADVTLALRLGILSNRALADLNYAKLKASGAFPKGS